MAKLSEMRWIGGAKWSLAIATGCFLLAGSVAADGADAPVCEDLRFLVEQSRSDFEAISEDRANSVARHLGWVDAESCLSEPDTEKTSYRCVWNFPLGSPEAYAAFEQLVDQVRACFVGLADESTDPAVNHPDFYAAHRWETPQGAANVSLKNKSALRLTLVTLRIDGPLGETASAPE